MSDIDIREVTTFDSSLVEPIRSLLRQLTSREIAFSEESLRQIISDKASRLFLLYSDNTVAGMLTLGIYSAPTGRKAWVEDVVVDSQYRGRGFGQQLVQYAISCVRTLSPVTLMLTSNPQRTEANALYRREGFEQRCTNVYKMDL
ncbi:MAG: GNAT family N-acetyltransferase [Alistipes sp.]|nr:GNAT family N-acetyltransferase [Alistipes sp.]